ncbi:DUF262 domain-containing protein [Streptococcus salivarius]
MLDWIKKVDFNDSETVESYEGIENEEPEELQPIQDRKLLTNKSDRSIPDILAMIDGSKLNLQPEYQRNFVWKNKQQSKFIESLILGIPVPTIFINENEDSTYEVIDGQQRLTTCYRFWNNELKLMGLETLTELNGKKFEDLDEDFKDVLKYNRTLSVVSILKESSVEIKFDIFQRLNEGAVKLNAQELRNVVYRGEVIKFLEDLSKNTQFSTVFNPKSNAVIRKIDQEIILRMLSVNEKVITDSEGLYILDSRYNGRLNTVMGEFLQTYRNSNKDLARFKERFELNLEKIFTVLGEDERFKNLSFPTSLISRPVAEFEYMFFDKLELTDVIEKKLEIKEFLEGIFKEESLLFQRATANKDTLSKRIDLINKYFTKDSKNGKN